MAFRFFVTIDDRLPAHDFVVYTRGAIVNGAQNAVTTVTVHPTHDIQIGDKFLYALNRTTILKNRVFTVTGRTATSVTFSGGANSFPDRALLVPLGTDSGGVQQPDGQFSDPAWDGTVVNAYRADGEDGYALAQVNVDAGGEVGFWCDTVDIWAIARNTRGNPLRVYMLSASGAAAGGGGVTLVTSDPGSGNAGDLILVYNSGSGEGATLKVWAADSSDVYHWETIIQIA